MENNKQLGPLYQMETFSDPVVKNLSPPMHTITTLKLQHNFVFVLFFFKLPLSQLGVKSDNFATRTVPSTSGRLL